jgi:hypothetical protein
MMRRPLQKITERRRGVILMVVLILLTLFAIVGLSFALYASSEAQSSRLFREAQTSPVPDVDPESLFDYFMNQYLYDTDDFSGIESALRGHSLARTMYGYNYKRYHPDLGIPDDPAYVVPNNVPFNGLGRLHSQPGLTPQNPFGIDDYNLINYTFFSSDGLLRDPERQTARTSPLQAPGTYVGGLNAPYTYPDLNNMFLAAVRADGTVLMPSYHRPWLFGSLMNHNNPNWTNPQGKYLTLRPRPADMSPAFPYPEDEGGDVKNLIGSPGYLDANGRLWNNDSIWIDLGYPVLTAPDGRKYKPLFAPLIVDLDNRVNINVHGNIRGTDPKTQKPIHLSNQGWGPWEVSLSQVLNASGAPFEWANLFGGLPDPTQPQQLLQRGRYGILDQRGQVSSPHPHAPWVPNNALIPKLPAPFYSPVNFDAAPNTVGQRHPMNGGRAGPIMLPPNDAKTFTCFPTYPDDYQGNSQQGIMAETTNHPLLYDYFQQTYDDRRRFLSSNIEALLRYDDTGSLALTSELFRLCPMNFGSDASSSRRRNLVTTHSFDLDRPGVMPWAYPVAPGNPGTYRLQPGDLFPNSSAPNSLAVNPQPGKGEYGPDGRASDALFGRVDLNRDLPPYPTPTDNGRLDLSNPNVVAQFNLAQSARQQLAKDIFDRLRYVTTGDTRPITQAITPNKNNVAEFNALRWLAQLAVNIVDYIDSDDYMTPFNWYPPYQGSQLGEWVYGTELPRLVINEAYAEYDNDPSDNGTPGMTATLPAWVNFWVELHNPFRRDPNLPDSFSPKDPTLWSAARLRMPQGNNAKAEPPYGVYQLLIAKAPDPNQTLQQPGNTLGNPSFPSPGTNPGPGQVVRMVNDFTSADPTKQPSADAVRASDGQYAPPPAQNVVNGFYVLGPNYNPPATAPRPFPPGFETLVTPNMTYKLPPPANILTSQFLKNLPPYGLFLQRLACPHLPPNPPAGSPPGAPPNPNAPYNPYITIDYLDSVPSYDGVRFSSNEPNTGHTAPSFSQRFSWGRRQPYAANRFEQMAQRPSPPLTNQVQNTFFRHNGETNPFSGNSKTLAYPFDWLIHLDRPLISPAELLNVSAFKPHELTHQFIVNQGGITGPGGVPGQEKKFQHRLGLVAASPQSRIYRVFEFLEAGSNRAMGTADGGRIPGKININTVWDPDTLAAVIDPQPANLFTAGNPQIVQNLFAAITQARTPKVTQNGTPVFGPNDRPFRGLATPFSTGAAVKDSQYPSGVGVSDTLLRNTADNSQLLFAVPQTQNSSPFLQYEVLNKIYNHLTTRSNVFAVWLTVGFFEVVQDTDAQGNPIRPVKLGAEIGKAEGRNIRHRMFAIVDRTNMTTLANVTQLTKDILAGSQSQTAQLLSMAGVTSSPPFPISWSIKPGSALTIEDPANPETVVVTSVAGNSITATFKAPHRRGTWVSLADTPGPPPIFIPSLPLTSFKGVVDTTKPTDVPIVATYDPSGPALRGTYEDLSWSIRPGDLLVVDSGANEEVVAVKSVSQSYPNAAPSDPAAPSFQAQFTKLHPGPLTIRFPNAKPGNPGPQLRFNPHDPVSAPIVRYFNIIE